MISYDPMWKTMKAKGITQYKLLKFIDNRTLHQVKHGNNITLKTLEKICKCLDCGPEDVIKFVNDPA